MQGIARLIQICLKCLIFKSLLYHCGVYATLVMISSLWLCGVYATLVMTLSHISVSDVTVVPPTDRVSAADALRYATAIR